MSTTAPPNTAELSALDLLNGLTPEMIRERLARLDAEAAALRLLLRAATRRARGQRPDQASERSAPV